MYLIINVLKIPVHLNTAKHSKHLETTVQNVYYVKTATLKEILKNVKNTEKLLRTAKKLYTLIPTNVPNVKKVIS